jgi:hypothetical protein
MYELLLRTETLFVGLPPLVLLIAGIVACGVGSVLWLGGSRHSAIIIGLFGAAIGVVVGLLASQWFKFPPWIAMIAGAVVLAGIFVLLRNVLILVLAVLVLSGLSGGGYLAVVLDRAGPQTAPEVGSASQSFTAMEPARRLAYMDEISSKSQAFEQRFKALLSNTEETVRPHFWPVVLVAAVGAVVAIALIWWVAKIVIALAYSIVGTTVIFLGIQATLLAARYAAVSALSDRRVALPVAFLAMILIGWIWQLFSHHRRTARKEPEAPAEQE